MTESEWLASTDPKKMLEFLRGNASKRKLRLFACGFCRQFWHLLTDKRSQRAVEVAERYADGEGTCEQLQLAQHQGHRATSEQDQLVHRQGHQSTRSHLPVLVTHAASVCCCGSAPAERIVLCLSMHGTEWQAYFLRDIFGDPFRPVSLAPAWLTPAVLKLAQAAYDNRHLPSGLLDNTALAILADALEEAGCANADILSHLRGPGPHVRGCWAVDVILGKS